MGIAETAVSADTEALVALWDLCGLTRPWNDPRSDIALALETPTSEILIIRHEAEIVASAMVGFDGHRGWVYYLAVAPKCRKAGLGKTIIAACEGWLRERGSPKIQYMVRDDNAEAFGFYESLGYERQTVVTFGRRLD